VKKPPSPLVGAALMVVVAGVVAGCSGGNGDVSSGSGGSGPSGSGGASSSTGGKPGTGGAVVSGGSGGGSGGSTTGTGGGSEATGGGSPAGGVSGRGGAAGSGMNLGGRGNAGGSGGAAGGPGPGNLKATMVVRGAGTATAGDMVMIGRIMAHGFQQVALVSDALVTAQSVVGSDLVVISSSAESGPLQSKLRDIAIPVLCVEDAEFSLMGMATSGGHDANVSQVTIVAAGSALVGAATGMVTFSGMPGDLGWAAGTNPATVVVGATMPGNATHAAIFGYPRGAQMAGMVAPARRGGFAIRETLAASLNAAGIRLFDAILEWVLQ
jgi:hypothetical protein